MNAQIKVLFPNLREPRVTVTTEGGFTAYDCHFTALETAVNTTRRNYEAAGYVVSGPVDEALKERLAETLTNAGFKVERQTLGLVVSLNRAISCREVEMALPGESADRLVQPNYKNWGTVFVNLLLA